MILTKSNKTPHTWYAHPPSRCTYLSLGSREDHPAPPLARLVRGEACNFSTHPSLSLFCAHATEFKTHQRPRTTTRPRAQKKGPRRCTFRWSVCNVRYRPRQKRRDTPHPLSLGCLRSAEIKSNQIKSGQVDRSIIIPPHNSSPPVHCLPPEISRDRCCVKIRVNRDTGGRAGNKKSTPTRANRTQTNERTNEQTDKTNEQRQKQTYKRLYRTNSHHTKPNAGSGNTTHHLPRHDKARSWLSTTSRPTANTDNHPLPPPRMHTYVGVHVCVTYVLRMSAGINYDCVR